MVPRRWLFLHYERSVRCQSAVTIGPAEVCARRLSRPLQAQPSRPALSIALSLCCLFMPGNIVTGDDMQTSVVVASGFLPAVIPLFGEEKQSIRKELCWAISNITAGTTHQIQAVLASGVLECLIQ